MSSHSTEPLEIVIVGAGIAGLSAAISLRRAGHNVNIYERSSLNHEIGAAIQVPPNVSRELLFWGLDPVKARFVPARRVVKMNGIDMSIVSQNDLESVAEIYGGPWFLAHRVDLHTELKRLAIREDAPGKPAIIHVGNEVVAYDVEAGSIRLASGRIVIADLIIGADGVHTQAAPEILGASVTPLLTNDYAYRFLIPSTDIEADPETARFMENNDGRIQFYFSGDKLLVWYPCRDNEEQNFAAFFHDERVELHEDWNAAAETSAFLDKYSDFHPSLLKVFRKAKSVKQWPLLFRAPISSWYKGKLVIIGDAAHPMLPHQGQGGAQAIEDAMALGIVLSDIPSRDAKALERSLELFQKIRINRASLMQIYSNTRQDSLEKIRDTAKKFTSPDLIPKNLDGFLNFNFGYDVVKVSKQALLDSKAIPAE